MKRFCATFGLAVEDELYVLVAGSNRIEQFG
jgi:hypothetical protein